MSVLPPDVPVGYPTAPAEQREMLILQEHYRAVRFCKTDEAKDKALKGWSDRHRNLANSLYARLFGAGFVVEGQGEDGQLYFGYRLKSELQQVMELSDADYKDYRAGLIVFDRQVKRLVSVQRASKG
jgi:hypothetical protein